MLKLGIELDGVLGNFTLSFVKVANSIWPGKISEDYEPAEWNWGDSGLNADEISQVWEHLKHVPNFWMTEAPYHDNVEALRNFLNERRYDTAIYYITSRVPTHAGGSVLAQTNTWLESWQLLRKNTSVLPVAPAIGTSAPDKLAIADALGIEAHIDDYLPTVRALGERGFLLDRSWNRKDRSAQDQIVPSLKAFLDMFQ